MRRALAPLALAASAPRLAAADAPCALGLVGCPEGEWDWLCGSMAFLLPDAGEPPADPRGVHCGGVPVYYSVYVME
jgi:hypothetical protein